MITVRTKEELEQALKNNKGASIRIEGPYAKTLANKIRTKKKVGKAAMVGGGLVVLGGILAVPFTGGMSLAGSAAGATAMGLTAGLTAGTVTITTTELAMILGVGGMLGGYALSKGYKIKVGEGGKSIELEPKQN